MVQENWKKVKLLKLVELLRRETDEQHPMTTEVLCEKMQAMDFLYDRKIAPKDIAALNSIGIEIMQTRVGKYKAYYIEDRTFSVPELKILMDAVQASSFLSESRAADLIDKLSTLESIHRARLLRENSACFNTTRKSNNKQVYYVVDTLVDALQSNRMVSFKYFNWDINKKQDYRKGGAPYIVEPISLVLNRDNYYLVTLSPQYQGLVNYRVDRMDSVQIMDQQISAEAIEHRSAMDVYTEQSFKMFTGPVETVELEFSCAIINAVLDNLGHGITMEPVGEDGAKTTVQVQISPTFFSWVFQFDGQMRILGPDHVVEQYRDKLRKQLGIV